MISQGKMKKNIRMNFNTLSYLMKHKICTLQTTAIIKFYYILLEIEKNIRFGPFYEIKDLKILPSTIHVALIL